MSNVPLESTITLQGSAAIIKKFLDYGINTILMLREVYPAESFEQVQRCGINLYLTNDYTLNYRLKRILHEIEGWLVCDAVSEITLVLFRTTSKEVVEYWNFEVKKEPEANVQALDGVFTSTINESAQDLRKIQNGIRAVLMQIATSRGYLPLLDGPLSFNITATVDESVEMPPGWIDASESRIKTHHKILNMSTFSTGLQIVRTSVGFKNI